jgi:hypothetical protein
MAYHEQHERKCPTCGKRISATAPECLNCGEFVDDDEGDAEHEEEGHNPRTILGWVSGVVGALGCVGLAVYLLARAR